MKISRLIAFGAAFALMAGMAACSGSKQQAAEEVAQVTTLSVDTILNSPEAFVGDTVYVAGECSHLCQHGGRKAFLLGADTTLVLRCEATAEMGGAFAPDCVGKQLVVTGVVCEQRIGEDEVNAMEEKYAATQGSSDHACSTEAKAQGQAEIDSFAARMANYRERIAARNEAEGKPYLSFYYIEAKSYDFAE